MKTLKCLCSIFGSYIISYAQWISLVKVCIWKIIKKYELKNEEVADSSSIKTAMECILKIA